MRGLCIAWAACQSQLPPTCQPRHIGGPPSIPSRSPPGSAIVGYCIFVSRFHSTWTCTWRIYAQLVLAKCVWCVNSEVRICESTVRRNENLCAYHMTFRIPDWSYLSKSYASSLLAILMVANAIWDGWYKKQRSVWSAVSISVNARSYTFCNLLMFSVTAYQTHTDRW